LQSIPATDVQECLFKQRRQGDSARANDDLNCDERSLIGCDERSLIERNLIMIFAAMPKRRQRQAW
jgi:hypothetical protein